MTRVAGTEPAVVTDTSPLIALARTGRDALLPRLFDRVVAPRAVAAEFGPLPLYIEIVDAPPDRSAELQADLDPGEAEAIALAERLGATLLIDERKGRRIARASGIRVRGTVGVLILASERGLIPAIRPDLDALIAAGFHVSGTLYADALRLAGETPW